MNPDKGVSHIKRILKKYGLHLCFKKFLDINLIDSNFEIPCSLINNHKIKFLISEKQNSISTILYEKAQIPIFTKNKVDEKIIQIFKKCLIDVHDVKDPEFYLGLFRFYLEILRLYKNNKDEYELSMFTELSYKFDIQQIAYVLDGLYKTKDYKQLLFEYHDVI